MNKTIPVSLSALFPQAAPTQPQQTPTESAIAVSGERVAELYRAFQNLRDLTKHLNGRNPAEPLPEHIAINSITVNYSANGVQQPTVHIRNVANIGDIAPLLARESERLVEDIRLECVNAQTAALTIEEACKRAQYATRAQVVGGPE